MAEVIFNYEGENISIQCNIDDKMEDIINRYLQIKNDNIDNLYYLYNNAQINSELTFNEQANELDKSENKMNITVVNHIKNINELKETISKDIICPKCKENALIDIKNFKINLSECKNNHNVNNILLNQFQEIQKINLNKKKCDICNKYNNQNNDFYICNTCNKNICLSCKSTHYKSHIIINFDDKDYICQKHNNTFMKFCKTCNCDICIFCEKTHNEHFILDFNNISIEKEELIKISTELKNTIEEFKWKANIIKEILNKMINMLDIYFNLNDYYLNNYNLSQRNYYILLNLECFKNNNEKMINDLKKIINTDKITDIFEYSYNNFYNENGEKYIGDIKNNLKEGKGIIYYDKDDNRKRLKYEGEFKQDKQEGKGIMYWTDGGKYEGEWKNGLIEGKGISYFKNGNRYEGDFKLDKYNGNGIYYFSNGSKYEGEFKNGTTEGKGILYLDNGDRYEGDWKNGVKEGKGIFYYSNGNRFEGEYKNNKREGKGIKYYKNGKKKEGIWKNDEYKGK